MANSTAAQDEYFPITIARTDSQGYANLDHNALNPKEDADIQQQERWEVILGGHLAYQLAPKDDKRQFKLNGFPKGYELRCAVRKDGTRDYYLYGHPAGSKAVYRTPGDFVLHLLWLVSNSTDRSQCSCDLCARMVDSNKQRQPVSIGNEAQPPAFARPANPPPQVQTQAPVQTQFQSQQPQVVTQPQPQVVPQPQPQVVPQSQPQPQPQAQLQAQTQPQAGAPARIPGVMYLSNVFRVGELVWYKHQAWRLGVILRVDPTAGNVHDDGDDSKYAFTLAPLGHSSLNQQSVVKDAASMRPFLTFSVPDISIPELVGKTHSEVDWPAFAAQFSQGNNSQMQMIGLEASKIAARSINDTYSLLNKISANATPDGLYVFETYKALYFGAELIYVKDPIRVLPDPNALASDPNMSAAIMVVSEIQLVTQKHYPPNPALSFRGSVYHPIRAPLPHPPNVVPPEKLGPVFMEELAVRNQIEPDKSTQWGWVLAEENAIRPDLDVQGRFYVTHKLMNIIDPERYQTSAKNGVVEEARSYLNSRAQSGFSKSIVRKASRMEAFGAATSVPFVPPEGMGEN